MKRIYWFWSLLILLLTLSNVISYIQFKTKSDLLAFMLEIKRESDVKLGILESSKECRLYELFYNGMNIDFDLTVTDINGSCKKMLDIFPNSTLVLRYSEMNCDVCVDSLIHKLRVYEDSIGLHNIALLTNAQDNCYLKRFRKINRIKFDIYNMDEVLDSILVDIGLPYFFILSPKEGKIHNMYVPQKEIGELTDKYLHSVVSKYFRE